VAAGYSGDADRWFVGVDIGRASIEGGIEMGPREPNVALRPVRSVQVGTHVRVKSMAEILATLDADGRVDGLPFMPEMLAFAGRIIEVDAVTHRTCDTVKTSGTSGTTRRLERSVHLRGARCDGSAHGGCQARCLLYWKLDWLEEMPNRQRHDSQPDIFPGPTVLAEATHGEGHTEQHPVYSCQATELLKASQFVSARNARMWWLDVRSGNASIRTAVASLAVLMFNKWQRFSKRLPTWLRIRGGRMWPSLHPTGERRAYPELGLQPGELVEVKSLSEIEATLDGNGAVRGLRFSGEMIPYCGTRARVLARVDRIIDEKTGRMLKLRDCIILEDVWCEGTFRALCRRKIYTYWREAWLRRIDSADPARYHSASNGGSA